ncbi:3-hydroxyacyl-CoA dehydrogenase family protein [Lactobacillus terrae]|uniref:3-hydroxyacyl-CoA dehydrogenase family protein n=1 Tax=Lactobacillus terrae TaxID=2269374 RepID=UPI000C1B6D61|nr:3-hydroxyacyl-CoA dehydrogenase family protein [Lactobacillus terrae]
MKDIKLIANFGTGTMGHGITLQFAMAGYDVNLIGHSEAGLNRGVENINNDLDSFVNAGLINSDDLLSIQDRIHPTMDIEACLENADFVIESVVEDLKIKQDLWEHIESLAPKDAIFATNTSGLSPTEISKNLEHKERFVVAHFYNPAQLMPLVEVVPSESTSQEVLDTTIKLMHNIDKKPVALKKETLGFVGNRLQMALIREALSLVEEGVATPQDIDELMKYSLGRRWSLVGPLESLDLGGLDVFDKISKYLYSDLEDNKGEDPTLKKLVDANKTGLKSGQGFYTWSKDKGQKVTSDRDSELIKLLVSDVQKTKKKNA